MRERWRGAALAAALVAAPLVLAGPPAAADGPGAPDVTVGEPSAQAPGRDEVTVPTDPVPTELGGRTVRFRAGPGAVLELADGRRFLDTLEVALTGDGQRLVNDLTADDYVAGVAEMPGRWHEEALKAQAVAARTYAWHLIELGTFDARGFDICDTVDCQVFRGAAQQETEFGDRWRAAVDATAGEVLLDDEGRPILARYFSTSGGRTQPNEVVFPTSGARPYLQGIDDPHDAVSPFHRWEVTFTREEFDALTSAGSTLAAVTPVVDVERLGPVDVPNVDMRFTGPEGQQVTLGSVEVRRFLSEVAPRRFPDRFPSAREDGIRPLPSTVPSSRFTVDVGEDEVVVQGRGWGHGVGMGQYGALGRARDGATYDEILAAYYSGLEPQRTDALPDRVRVGLSRVEVGSVRGETALTVATDGEVVVERATGTWTLDRDGDRIAVIAPPGWGQPAEVSRTEASNALPSGAHAVVVAVTSATPGEASLRVRRDGDDEVVRTHVLGAVDAGPVTTRWDLRDDEGERVPAGAYSVAVEVETADGTRDGTPLPVTVRWSEPAGPLAGPLAEAADRPLGALAALAALALLVVALLVADRRRRRRSSRLPVRPPGGGSDGAGSRLDAGPSARDARSEPVSQEDT